MPDPPNLILIATDVYTEWVARCPVCKGEGWRETTHSLWNVAAVPCPWCGTMLAVEDQDFHGDSNAVLD